VQPDEKKSTLLVIDSFVSYHLPHFTINEKMHGSLPLGSPGMNLRFITADGDLFRMSILGTEDPLKLL
jgi:hypothetical protein